jgi:hypothetical protein
VRFNDDDFEAAISFAQLPRGAKRPSAIFWVHDDCARRVAHDDFTFPETPTT